YCQPPMSRTTTVEEPKSFPGERQEKHGTSHPNVPIIRSLTRGPILAGTSWPGCDYRVSTGRRSTGRRQAKAWCVLARQIGPNLRTRHGKVKSLRKVERDRARSLRARKVSTSQSRNLPALQHRAATGSRIMHAQPKSNATEEGTHIARLLLGLPSDREL